MCIMSLYRTVSQFVITTQSKILGIQFLIPMFGQMTSNIKHGITDGVCYNIITV